jgi:hypothetical protein
LTGEIDLECREKPVRWEEFDLDFTFLIFTLRKVATAKPATMPIDPQPAFP